MYFKALQSLHSLSNYVRYIQHANRPTCILSIAQTRYSKLRNVQQYHHITTIFIIQQWFRPHGLLDQAHHHLWLCQGHLYFSRNVCISTIAIAHGPSVPDGEANSFGIVLLIIYTLHMSSCCVKTKYAHPSEALSIV
jgi:hypothetical protein